MAADVRAGLDEALQGALPALLLRRARLGAVRGDHRASRVLPDPGRARDPRAPRRRDLCDGGKPHDADRARLRLREQDPRAARRDARGRLPRGIRAGGHLRADHARHRRGRRRRVRDHRARPRLRLRARPGANTARRAASDRLPRRDDRELRAGRSAPASWRGSRTSSGRRITSCSAPTWSRTAGPWRPPTTTPPG